MLIIISYKLQETKKNLTTLKNCQEKKYFYTFSGIFW